MMIRHIVEVLVSVWLWTSQFSRLMFYSAQLVIDKVLNHLIAYILSVCFFHFLFFICFPPLFLSLSLSPSLSLFIT